MRLTSSYSLMRAAVGASLVLAVAASALVARAQRAPERNEPFGRAVRLPGASPPTTCALSSPASDTHETQACLQCHASAGSGATLHGNHPIGLDYAAVEAQISRFGTLRPIGEVVRRGVLLPQGKVECVTCHDARSPWAAKIALPPGSVAFPAVNPRDSSTSEGRESWRTARPDVRPPPPGSAVSPSPLCIACHALD